jgi:2-dehydropantoate 2-reductase
MWQIIGAGAIGCLWAANLKRIGKDVHFVTRKTCSTNTLHYLDLQQQLHRFEISTSNRLINNHDPVLVCVKATQVQQAIQEQLQMFGKQQPIILMHNGMGCAEQVAKLLPDNPIVCATTANASLLLAPLKIQQTGLGHTYLGAFNQAAKQYKYLAERLNSALTNTCWADNIQQKLWLKLIINSVINPLTALYQIKNGGLQNSDFQEKIAKISAECTEIAQAEQLSFQTDKLLNTIHQVIAATAENYSSMNRDLFFRRQTENEYINGYLLKKAQQHKIAAPCITTLYQKLQEAEKINAADNEKFASISC